MNQDKEIHNRDTHTINKESLREVIIEELKDKGYSEFTETGLFCKKCNHLIRGVSDNPYAGMGISLLSCLNSKCNMKYYTTNNLRITTQAKSKREITVIGEDERADLVTHQCSNPRCGSTKAYLIHIPPRISDEDDLQIYHCAKCGRYERIGYSY